MRKDEKLFCCSIMSSFFISRVVVLVLIEEFQVVGLILLIDENRKIKAPTLILKFFLSCN